jgi:uncharacterized coiled-coil DUF342 family protein
MEGTMSIEQTKIAHVLSRVGPTLRKLASERDELLAEVDQLRATLNNYQEDERIHKIAEALGDKTSFSGTPLSERIDYIRKRAEADGASLDVLEEAAHLMSKEGSLGSLAEKTASGNSQAIFEAMILGAL